MKRVIIYCSIDDGASIFAIPTETHREVVEFNSQRDLDKYVTSKTDDYGNVFKKKRSLGFDYISRAGGVRIKAYKPPVIKKI